MRESGRKEPRRPANEGLRLTQLTAHREALLACRSCPDMIGPVVTGAAVVSEIFLIGQAPGPREGQFGRPFAYTAGKTMFRWFGTLGVDEETFRSRAFMAAVARCFPGKAKGGGDRVPRRDEIERCREWMAAEAALVLPRLIVPVGQLAIGQVLGKGAGKLDDVVGRVIAVDFFGREVECIALPHPSGLSTWHKVEPGKTLLRRALDLLGAHPSWVKTFGAPPSNLAA
jgi:uracil-DNA glycosylase